MNGKKERRKRRERHKHALKYEYEWDEGRGKKAVRRKRACCVIGMGAKKREGDSETQVY